MSATLTIDDAGFERVVDAVASFEGDAEQAINEILHGEAGEIIYGRINPLIHPSGRRFRGHSTSATRAKWPLYETNQNLAVTVTTRSSFNYLYFPDDGTNTRKHAGNQQFFRRGAEAAVPEIVERCLARLTEEWS